MPASNVNLVYTSDTSVLIPDNAVNVTWYIQSTFGGTGGSDAGNVGGVGGAGRTGSFRYKTNFVGRTVTIRIGQTGASGSSNVNSGSGLRCGGSSIIGSGGCGGAAGPSGFSGQGASGAGATGIQNSSGDSVIAAGGGGGGGGASYGVNGSNGGNAAGWVSYNGAVPTSSGANGASTPGDGGGGGGGGGGAPGAGGGNYGLDFNRGNIISGGGYGGGSGYNASEFDFIGSDGISFSSPRVDLSYEFWTPSISTFYAQPSTQTSSNGTPQYSTLLAWGAEYFSSLTLTSSAGESWNVTGTTTQNITNLPQSIVGSNSPASRTYTLTACAGTVCTSQTITVYAQNDNTPNNYTVASKSNLEPNTVTSIFVGSIQGIDMPTIVDGGPGVQVSTNNANWSGTGLVSPGGNLWVRAISPSFNQDPSGLTNSSQFYVDVGPVRRFFTLTTRAPDVNETFNISNYDDKLPYPDIDTIPGTPDQYITTNALTIDDIEIPVEIKTNNSNAQIRIKSSGSASFGSWQDVRNI